MKIRLHTGVSLVIIIGLVAILATVALEAVSRSVVDVRISKQEEEEARAFSVAELGLERALVGEGVGATTSVEGGEVEYLVTEAAVGGVSGSLVWPYKLASGERVTIWLIGHTAAGEFDPTNSYNGQFIDLYWQDQGSADETALEAVLYYEAAGEFKTMRFPLSESGGDDFYPASTGDFTLDGTRFDYYQRLSPSGAADFPCDNSGVTCYLLRVRFLGNENTQSLGVQSQGGTVIFQQGSCYDASAEVVASGVTSRLERCVFYKDFPDFLDFAVFSQTDLIK